MPVPVLATAYSFYVSLADAADPSSFKVDPTIAEGDFKISIDSGALANLTNLPAASPSGSSLVLVSLTADEMNGAKINIQAIDVAGDEWQSLVASIDVPTGSSESINDIQLGDHVETSTRLTINQQGTAKALVDKDITGSLLSSSVTISTTEAS